MTSDFPNKQDKPPSKGGCQKKMHQGSAQSRKSSSATEKEVGVHSRSMKRGGSMNRQHLSIGADTEDSEDEELLVRAQETTKKTKGNGRPTNQEASFSFSSALFARLPSFVAGRSSAMSNDSRTHKENSRSSSEEQFPQQIQSDRHKEEGIRSAKPNALCMSRESLDGIVESINEHHAARQDELERQVRDLQRRNDNSKDLLGKLQAQNKQLESEKQAIEEKHNTLILKQQEMTFSHMPSSRWAPVEDSKVMEDLDRLKRDMRSWAKKVSANDLGVILKALDGHQQRALRPALENVIIFDKDYFPQGLSMKKAPALLLNALLSHSVYTALFWSPFFFLEEEQTPKSNYRVGLEGVYNYGCRSREEDSHIWRSQTLRLLLPPLATDTSEDEKKLRVLTEEMIFKVADREASIFLEGAVTYLMDNEALAKFGDELYAIYREAAMMSYNLWTRRTKLVCYTLLDGMGGCPHFDPNSKDMIAHSSVDYESHADQLVGRPISIVLHPCLMVYGTDDGKHYDQGRVWAPAEVWLDSRKPCAE